jgi:hypothetical protein
MMLQIRQKWSRPLVGAFCILSLPTVMGGLVAGGVAGCGVEEGFQMYSCKDYIQDRLDDFGDHDPCCHKQICCANPLVDHYAMDPVKQPPVRLWDPCCKTEACPSHNVNWPPAKDIPTPTQQCDAGADAQTSSCAAPCDGECLARGDLPMWGPLLLWVGPADQKPACPHGTTPIAGQKYTNLNVPPLDCPTCSCDPPTGTCELPTTMTANSSGYPGTTPGAAHTDFSPPANWDGSCTAANAIAAGAMCNGAPCVKSLTVAPLTLTESDCTPRVSAPPHESPPPSWQSSTIMCSLEPCDGGKSVCVPPANARPSGWETCLAVAGEASTCGDPYPVRRVVYDSFTDGRSCGTCACDSPRGSYCVSTLSVSEGNSCKGPAAIPGNLIFSQPKPFCFDLGAGIALGSKTMTRPTYAPGSCETRTMDGSGEVTTQGAVTLCCREAGA